jgi:hypothetical protein
MVLADHCEIRGRLDRITRYLDAEHVESHGDTLDELRDEFAYLARFFLAHLDFEDVYLTPLMLHTCAWGEIRAFSLMEHHTAQREELDDLIALANSPSTDPIELRRALDHFAAALDADMLHEESSLLTPEVIGVSLPAVKD